MTAIRSLLAALFVTAPSAQGPLLDVAMYVPHASDDPAADLAAARRMAAAWGYWLGSRGHVAAAESGRGALIAAADRRIHQPEAWIQALGDRLERADIAAAVQAFASVYLQPLGEGRLGDDYFRHFVQAEDGLSLRDAHPSPADYETFATFIDDRAHRFGASDPTWDAPLAIPSPGAPKLWQSGTEAEWLTRLATYSDLLQTRPRLLRTRIEEYWSLVDAAPDFGTQAAAEALIRTYFTIDDASIQQATEGALRAFPIPTAVAAILATIEDLALKTSSAPTIVDIFPDTLDDQTLEAMAAQIRTAPEAARAAYLDALTTAADDGSDHAESLRSLIRD